MTAQKEATERMFFNADRTKFVKENDPEARTLAAAVGDPIPELAEPETKTKRAEAHTDKQAEASSDKAAKK